MFSIQNIVDFLRQLYDQYGYLIVFFGALAENTAVLGLVLPGATLTLLGAFYARQGSLNLGWVIVLAWLGTVLGYTLDYLVGRLVLVRMTPLWASSRLGRRLRLAGRLRLGRALLHRYGGRAILISHVIGHVRSFVALTAGMTHMPFRRFVGFELLAALLWTLAYCVLGYIAGAEWSQLQHIIERAGWVIAGALVAAYIVWRVLRARKPRRRRRPVPTTKPPQ